MSIFSRNKAPKADKPEGKAAAITALRNTPNAVLGSAGEKFAEIYGSSLVNANRWFLFGFAALMLAGLSVIGIVVILPLKEVRPWLVEYNPTTGVVNRPVEVRTIDPNEAVVKAELARWVESVYTLDQARTVDLMRWANGRCADKCLAQFAEFRNREKVYERLQKESELSREAKVITVDVAQKGTAFVFVQTTERASSGTSAVGVVKRYRVTLNYRFSPATKEQDLFANPTGIVTTFFSDAEERKL